MSIRRPTLSHFGVLLVVALVGFVTLQGPTSSSATFTSRSGAMGQVSAAADWTPPTVTVVSPGPSIKDVAMIAINASDAETSIASVTLERRAASGDTWVTICTDSTEPFACAWDTRPLVDGQYALRARATDRTGLEATSAVVSTTVANKLLVDLSAPDTDLRGSVALSTSVYNAGALKHTVRLEYAASDTTNWKTICSGLSSPYACTWNTTAVPADDYDLRAVVVDSSGRVVATSELVEVTVDNIAPSISLANPGSPLSGERTFATTAADAHSGVELVVVQYAATGTSTWRDLCSINEEPWTCVVATTSLADGNYSFRAIATDAAGNTTISAIVTNRVVDNTVSSVSVSAAATLTRTVQITASAASTAGVGSVLLQYATDGSGSWTDLCTDSTAPYACSWDTTTVPNGTYSLRAVLTDGLGRTTISDVVSGRRVDNSTLKALDVQSANGGSTAGRADNGDTFTFIFSNEVSPASVLAGWNGTSRGVTVRLRDGAALGLGAKDDTLDVQTSSGAAINLGSVNLKGDYVRKNRTALFTSTMTAETITGAGGVPQTKITLRLGALQIGTLTSTKTVKTGASATMAWTPSGTMTDLQGRPCSPLPVSETGPLDREF